MHCSYFKISEAADKFAEKREFFVSTVFFFDPNKVKGFDSDKFRESVPWFGGGKWNEEIWSWFNLLKLWDESTRDFSYVTVLVNPTPESNNSVSITFGFILSG